ncbi:hypothetical protein [Fulvivirga lutimaris]|uniref:hypothetical protein n=1 Tax=Fulvivirga lutimaris TaxID=1819566 RepID=UPI0012BC1150|nr:hypothetical protein [Fulvivirga lutimaris]MTI41727.1 hypothetical protein [Fulvivirga lutimaris]
METTYQFETEYFRFSGNEIELLRSNFPYKKVNFSDIKRLSVNKSISVKRPLLLGSFGLVLTCSSLYFLFYSTGIIDFILFDRNPHTQSARAIGSIIIMFGFLLVLGSIAIYQATIPQLVLRTEFIDGTFEIFNLKTLSKKEGLDNFILFLKSNFQPNQLEIDFNIFR